MMQLHATVASGRGWALKDRAEDVAELSAIEGRQFVNGSLNLVAHVPVWLNADFAMYKRGTWLFWRALLENVPVVIGRWTSGCPAHVFEIYAAVRLRDALKLEDGHVVKLTIPDQIVSITEVSVWNRVIWSLFWKYRERLIYCDGLYMAILRTRVIRRYAWRSMQNG